GFSTFGHWSAPSGSKRRNFSRCDTLIGYDVPRALHLTCHHEERGSSRGAAARLPTGPVLGDGLRPSCAGGRPHDPNPGGGGRLLAGVRGGGAQDVLSRRRRLPHPEPSGRASRQAAGVHHGGQWERVRLERIRPLVLLEP